MIKKVKWQFLFLVFLLFLVPGCAKEKSNEVEKTTATSSISEKQEEENEKEIEEKVNKETEEKDIEGTEEVTEIEQNEIEENNEQENENTEIVLEEMTPKTNGKIIVIDPGHSAVVATGTEPLGPGSSEYKAADTSGTSGATTGIPEYELTLTVSKKLKTEMENRGYTTILTRETNDIPLSCTQRADIANQNKADAFIRIHANGSENSEAQGAMTICTTPSNPYAPELYDSSRALSDSIINHLCAATGCENDGVWETDSMSGNNWSQVPVTIVEMGYMTNYVEDELMATEGYQTKLIQGIADGIDEFFGLNK